MEALARHRLEMGATEDAKVLLERSTPMLSNMISSSASDLLRSARQGKSAIEGDAISKQVVRNDPILICST